MPCPQECCKIPEAILVLCSINPAMVSSFKAPVDALRAIPVRYVLVWRIFFVNCSCIVRIVQELPWHLPAEERSILGYFESDWIFAKSTSRCYPSAALFVHSPPIKGPRRARKARKVTQSSSCAQKKCLSLWHAPFQHNLEPDTVW